MEQTQITHSFEETQQLGEQFAQKVHGGDAILLFGDLGAGKTTFMQGLAKGLGIRHRIISPTFIIVRKYEVPIGTITYLYHIDLYRTETEADLKGLGIPEILEEKNAVVAIEWCEKLGSLLPKKRWEVAFEWVNENERKIIITSLT